MYNLTLDDLHHESQPLKTQSTANMIPKLLHNVLNNIFVSDQVAHLPFVYDVDCLFLFG